MKKVLGILAAMLLTACAGDEMVHKFNDESYLKATSIPAMEIPEDLEKTTYIEPYYPAPAGEYPDLQEDPISIEPPELGELIENPQEGEVISKEENKE